MAFPASTGIGIHQRGAAAKEIYNHGVRRMLSISDVPALPSSASCLLWQTLVLVAGELLQVAIGQCAQHLGKLIFTSLTII